MHVLPMLVDIFRRGMAVPAYPDVCCSSCLIVHVCMAWVHYGGMGGGMGVCMIVWVHYGGWMVVWRYVWGYGCTMRGMGALCHHLQYMHAQKDPEAVGPEVWDGRERERSTRGDRVLFSSVGLWEGFLGVKITRIPYHCMGW